MLVLKEEKVSPFTAANATNTKVNEIDVTDELKEIVNQVKLILIKTDEQL